MTIKTIKQSFKRSLSKKSPRESTSAPTLPVAPPPRSANSTPTGREAPSRRQVPTRRDTPAPMTISSPAPSPAPTPTPTPTPAQTTIPAPVSSTSTCTQHEGNQDTLLNGIGPYRFQGQLGNGKFSRVMRARHCETGQLVAVKVIDKQAHGYRVMSRLVREVNLMQVLEHGNIVKLYETFETCDSLFLVMEYIPGMNLDEYLHSKGGTLTEDEARYLFRQMVSAVYYCHNRWVVHRDLKTPNIMITPDGVVKLADFGLGNRFGLQRLKTICGSMLYYSPEIITGQQYFGPEVDCWCLGVALFRMTTGREPFAHAQTVGQLKKDVCNCNYTMPDTLSADLQATIRKCLQVDRRKRMTVRLALQNDAWLTQSGQLACLFAGIPRTGYDEVAEANLGEDTADPASRSKCRAEREHLARRQFIKDLGRDKTNSSHVGRTIVYHPINTSIYFTTTTPSSLLTSTSTPTIPTQQQHPYQYPHHQHHHHNHPHIEMLRSELLHAIRVQTRRLGLRPTERWDTSLIRSPMTSLAHLIKRKEDDTNRSLTLAEMVHRFKDQVYHFYLGRPSRRGSRPPSLSSSLSTSTSSLSSVQSQPPLHPEDTDKLMRDAMVLVTHTCQLMGVSYTFESATRLLCVLTLRDTPKTKEAAPQTGPVRRQSERSTRSTSSRTTAGRSSEDSHPLRFSLPPLISHLTSSMTTSFFGRGRQRHSTDGSRPSANRTTSTANSAESVASKTKKKDGVALFTIDLELQKRAGTPTLTLRFSKRQGSTAVFKMAGGWITGVLGLSETKRFSTTPSSDGRSSQLETHKKHKHFIGIPF